jgi:3-oxoacyl-[acyl-carrier protein] reductase
MSDSVFLIFGGNSAIGTATARRLVAQGGKVVLAGRNQAKLDAAAASVGATTMVADPAQPDTLRLAVEQTVSEHGRLDGVANCFGTVLLKPAHLTTDEEWEQTIRVNLTSAFAITRAAARAFPPEGGSVVFVSTVAARIGLANHEAIAAAKAGLHGLALSAAATYAAKKIRFNVVAPGLTRTPLTEKITGNEAALKASTAMHPLGRIGEPDEVAAAIAWFLDPAQSWVTGQILGVDGGLGSVRGRAG